MYNLSKYYEEIENIDSKIVVMKQRIIELSKLIEYLKQRYSKIYLDPRVEYKITEKIEDKVTVTKTVQRISPSQYAGNARIPLSLERESIMSRPRNWNKRIAPETEEITVKTPNEILEIVTLKDQGVEERKREYYNEDQYNVPEDIDDGMFSNIGSEIDAVHDKNQALSNRTSSRYY